MFKHLLYWRNNMDQWEQEERDLDEQLERGEITEREYTKRMNKIQQDYRESTRESAQDAYDNEMEGW